MSRVRPLLLLAGAALVVLCYSFSSIAERVSQRGLFWDVDYYRAAADHFASGENPYLSDGDPTGYFYSLSLLPPMVAWRQGKWSDTAYACLVGASVAASLWLVLAALPTPRAPLLLVALYILAFGNAQPAYLFVSGNLAWMAGLCQAGALFAASRRRWLVFYALTGLAALIKPYSLALLIVPVAKRRLSPAAVVAVLPLLADALVSRWLWPSLVEGKAEAIWRSVGEPLMLRYSLAGGVSRLLVFAGFAEPQAATLVGILLHLGFLIALILVLRSRTTDDGRSLAWAAVAVCCAFPRLAGYDVFVYGPAMLAALWPRSKESPWPGAGAFLILALALLKEGLVILPVLVLVYLVLEAGSGFSATRPGRDEVLQPVRA